ncbi:putative bifunctional diguanylate cyclase/phosphodiesterase [Granulicella cerasi]|uniref:Bifunctional diguanylate cyclase/phosphodiesterase n=1 Tax=Granulicella cerasi TaxID=741063 RepID=A0ABW1ZD77_9BACT|nr:GGDEF domain-containing phosphodiesterase [Granulicella cerasi]
MSIVFTVQHLGLFDSSMAALALQRVAAFPLSVATVIPVSAAALLAFTLGSSLRKRRVPATPEVDAPARISKTVANQPEFRSTLQSAPFPMILTDAAGTILEINAPAQHLTLYTAPELMGRRNITHLHKLEELRSRAQTLQSSKRSARSDFEVLCQASECPEQDGRREWTYVRKDGTEIPVQVAVSPLRDKSAEITGYIVLPFDATERKSLTESVEFMSKHDALTRLPNRAYLNSLLAGALEDAKRDETPLTLFLINLDHFKRINDSLGHSEGDQLLITVANRLRESVRASDFVARTASDEFVVVARNLGEPSAVAHSASRLHAALSQPLTMAGHEINITASIGSCTFPDCSFDTSSIVRHADLAMHAAKRRGEGNFHAFNEQMREDRADRLALEAELRYAIDRDEMEIYYQPQVNTRTRTITGMEALLRWKHPKRGMVPPLTFIRAAEESGLIVSIGEWVLENACREARAMQIQTGRRLTLAVNLSPRQVLSDGLFDTVQRALLKSGLNPRDLELEITENTLMISSAETLSTLARLRELGVRLAVDDFGTGFSSFQYILEYRVDRLKIDRSFITNCATDVNAAAIVRAVVAMAHGLDMTVVAEGVETEEQLAFLLRRRCEEAQGFLFGKPQPIHILYEQMAQLTQESEELQIVPITESSDEIPIAKPN